MGCGRNDCHDNVKGADRHDGCICEVVRAIKRIQGVADDIDCDDCKTDCFTKPLGGITRPTRRRFNTRVFMLLTEDGDPFKAMFKNDHRKDRGSPGSTEHGKHRKNCFSVFFRVQNVFDNCCATLQVLEPRNQHGSVNILCDGKVDLEKLCDVDMFEATDTCITVDLKCFCGIQCVKDVFIDCDRA